MPNDLEILNNIASELEGLVKIIQTNTDFSVHEVRAILNRITNRFDLIYIKTTEIREFLAGIREVMILPASQMEIICDKLISVYSTIYTLINKRHRSDDDDDVVTIASDSSDSSLSTIS